MEWWQITAIIIAIILGIIWCYALIEEYYIDKKEKKNEE
jgi:hypothetical protein